VRFTNHALEKSGVLGIDRNQLARTLREGFDNDRAGRHQALLVGQRQSIPGGQSAQRGGQACEADHTVDDGAPILSREFNQRFRAEPDPSAEPGGEPLLFISCRCAHTHETARVRATDLKKAIRTLAGGHRGNSDAHPGGNLERLRSD
jgi:hypothetical protein